MKPDWKDAPEWAKYLAMDSDGWWYWYENEPVKSYGGWNIRGEHDHDSNRYASAHGYITWQDSMEPRP